MSEENKVEETAVEPVQQLPEEVITSMPQATAPTAQPPYITMDVLETRLSGLDNLWKQRFADSLFTQSMSLDTVTPAIAPSNIDEDGEPEYIPISFDQINWG